MVLLLKSMISCFVFLSVFNSSAKTNLAFSGETAIRGNLHDLASENHHNLGYDSARRELMGDIYLEKDSKEYFVTDVYCEHEYTSPGPGKIPDHRVLNVEHTWPQSRFGGQDRGMQKSDLHHLFPSDSGMNSIRGNHSFGEVNVTLQTLDCTTSKYGLSLMGDVVFEPPSRHKGNVARALFYFSVRYNLAIHKEEEETLRKWHEADPVDQEELQHHEEIKHIQGNINPFIEKPDLVSSVSDF